MRTLLLLGCAACAGTGGGRLAARLQRPHNPEQRFDVAARAQQCRGGHGVLLEAASEDGNGLLLWLRGDSLAAGEYPLRTASDTSPGRAATASLRYMTGDIAHKRDKAPIQAGQRRHVERTNAWHNSFNRLQRCYERNEDVIDAFFDLADAIITVRRLIREAWTLYRWDGRPARRP